MAVLFREKACTDYNLFSRHIKLIFSLLALLWLFDIIDWGFLRGRNLFDGPQRIQPMINLVFSVILISKPKEVPRVSVVEPPQKEEIRDIVYDNIQLPMVLISYKIPEQTSEDYYAVEMLTKALADGQSSRLDKELVDKEQIALTSGAFTVATEDPGLFIALGLSNLYHYKKLEISLKMISTPVILQWLV